MQLNQAKEIVRSQNEKSKRKRRMPRFNTKTANLDGRFVEIENFNGSFDICLKFGSGAPKVIIPLNLTKHGNKFIDKRLGVIQFSSFRILQERSLC